MVAVPKLEYGNFYKGDSYIILSVSDLYLSKIWMGIFGDNYEIARPVNVRRSGENLWSAL